MTRQRVARLSVALAATLLVPVAPAPAGAQDAPALLEAAVERLERARADALFLLAPAAFARAVENLERARGPEAAGPGAAERAVREALAALAEAERAAAEARPRMQPVLDAREAALEAGAADHDPRRWEQAEAQAREIGRRLERGDDADSGERVARAVQAFREAEVEAVRTDVLGRAQEERRAAGSVEAWKRAPRTAERADSLLVEAERRILEPGGDLGRARELAEQAAAEFRHAARLAALADSVDRRRVRAEDLLLRSEARLARIAAVLGFASDFAAGPDSVAEDALHAIRSVLADREALREDLAARTAEVERLDRQVDALDARLAELEEREAAAAAELRERRRAEQRLREVRAIFAPDEAEVVASLDRVVVRLFGLTFDSGSDEIRPADFGLLTKLERIVREFPEARIRVEGHTDSVGRDDVNQALSQRRAIAVRDWLLRSVAMSADRITAAGYGESRPIAPNDTADGRARNRRIDVVIDASGD
ncbi:MAG: OmpA family protein [Gemmatimonadota bacterium]|nr:OmpA family protein [Gemmatimonadota bacterium]